MKCDKCGFENNDGAKFCTMCGQPLNVPKSNNNNSRYIIIGLVAVIIILVVVIGFFALNNGTSDSQNNAQDDAASEAIKSNFESNASDKSSSESSSESESSSRSVKNTQVSKSKSWESIGSYSGSGSGSQTISVPAGKIMVKLSAYPIKNYATNHLYVSASNGESGGVDWGSKSAVATKSDSFTYESSSSETFSIDYYETVSWEVEF